jgi:1-acyl-sn-glycerol-3-phosphate acyltransferase
MNRAVACWKLLRAATHLLGGMGTMLWRFPAMSTTQRQQAVQAWAVGVLDCFAIQLAVAGKTTQPGPVLLAVNHVSWLDITALHAARYCRFIAKADLRAWPLIGWMAHTAGTLFIQRESRRDALRVVHQMADSLDQGDALAIFPEGTTSDGNAVLPFHANLLQAAISRNAPVQPVYLRYVDAQTGQASHAADFVGDDFFLTSVWRTLRTPGLKVVVQFGEPQWPQGRDRRSWAADLRAEVLQLQAQSLSTPSHTP